MTPAPTAAEQAEYGLTLEDVAADLVCDVWPDNITAVNVFTAVMNQWRVGPAGPYALDHAVLPLAFQMNDIAQADQPAVFMDLRVMEREALHTWRRLNGS